MCLFFVKSDYTGTTTSEVDFVKYPFGYAKFNYMMRQVPLPTTPVIYENVYGYTTTRQDPEQLPPPPCTTTSTTSVNHYRRPEDVGFVKYLSEK